MATLPDSTKTAYEGHPKSQDLDEEPAQEVDKNKPQAWNPETILKPPSSYNQVCVTPILPSSKFITLAGQTGTTKDGTPKGFLDQVRNAYGKVLEALSATGATARDIIHVRHYVVTKTGDEGLDKVDIVERGWAKLWEEMMDKEGGGHRPPDTVVGVAALAISGVHYEVECWAIVHS